MQSKKITLFSGDGIGPEVSQEGEKLLHLKLRVNVCII